MISSPPSPVAATITPSEGVKLRELKNMTQELEIEFTTLPYEENPVAILFLPLQSPIAAASIQNMFVALSFLLAAVLHHFLLSQTYFPE